MSVRIVYFAWVRERIGVRGRDVELPDSVITARPDRAWMKTRGENTMPRMAMPTGAIRIAINEEHVEHDEALGMPREIALFPPMTGGLAVGAVEIRRHPRPGGDFDISAEINAR
jgi:molybdopterin synthase sulfur carrier subunit